MPPAAPPDTARSVRAAVRALRQLNREAPGNPDILLALVNYSAELGMPRAALEYAETLVIIAPENEAWRRLRDQLAGAVR